MSEAALSQQRLRICFVHSYYVAANPSGENVAVDAQVAALRRAGHAVQLVQARSDDHVGDRLYPLRAAWDVATGHGTDPTAALDRFQPDVVHVHNLFPNFGTRWLAERPEPVVATLHNYRPVCAGGTLFREGAACTACPDGDPWASVRHGCYRGSRGATLPLAIRNRRGARGDAVLARAERVVVLAPRSRALYERFGVPAARLRVVPNFVAAQPGPPTSAGEQGRWLFAGRLSAEKGLVELMQRWPGDHSLDVVGDGALLARARAAAPGSVRFRGLLPHEQLVAELPGYLGLVVPSRWFEGLPTVYLEALAAGLPTVALVGNSVADDVTDHGTGAVLPLEAGPGDWAAALADVAARRAQLSATCTRSSARFTEHAWVTTMEAVYAEAAAARAASGQ